MVFKIFQDREDFQVPGELFVCPDPFGDDFDPIDDPDEDGDEHDNDEGFDAFEEEEL